MSGKTYGTGVREVRERLRQLALYRDAVGGDDPLLDFYVKVTAKVLDCERCSIFIRDRATGKVFLKSGTGLKERDIVVDVDTSVVGKVIETGEPVIMEGMHQREGVHKAIDARTGFTTRNILCIPVYSLNSKRVVGAVQVLNKVDGTPFDELLPGAGALHRALADALREGQGLTVRELAIETAAGRPVTVDATLTLLGERGDALLVELVALDRHRLIAQEQQLASQQETLREVVRGLAHEIKNPLGGLRGAAQLLERRVTDDTARECARVILTEADRLRALVDALLGPSQRAAREPTNLHEVIEHVLALIAHDAPNLALVRDYDPSLPELTAVRDHLTQALLNLCRNAAQAIESTKAPDDARRRARGTLTLRTRALRQYTLNGVRHRLVARVDVEDDGPGVPPALRERLFFPMVSGRDGGSGLGLAIAQDLVVRHGGLIEWESEPGRTRFSLLLPLLDDKREGT